ncbi:MAG: hypothetical protein SH817_02850 [Leptospira sp.]|nr:hypothetical protein [Leptospira sp.]
MPSVSRKYFFQIVSGLFFSSFVFVCRKIDKKNFLYFSEREQEIVSCFSETILPNLEDNMPTIAKAEVIRRLDEEFSFVSEDIQEEFHNAIFILEYLPFFYGYFSKFQKLNQTDRFALLMLCNDTNSDIIRAVIGNLKLVTFLAYYGHRSSWEQIGYDGPFGDPPEKWSESRIYYQEMLRNQK